MNRLKFQLGRIALLVIAGMVGFLWGRKSSVDADVPESRPVVANAAAPKAPIEERHVPGDSATVASVAAELKSPSRLEGLRAAADLNQVLSRKISVSMISSENLDKDFVALFALSGGEVKSLNDAIAKVKAQLDALQWAHARIEPKGPEKFTITIPAFPREGGLVLDEFMKTVRSTLGDDRYAYYKSISRSEAEMGPALGGGFGLTQTVINLEDLSEENGTRITSGASGIDEKSGGMTLTINTGLNFVKAQYPVIYRKLLDSGAIARGSKL